MSALRLALEQEKEERWDKLQRRLEAVQQRRVARLTEMQRRWPPCGNALYITPPLHFYPLPFYTPPLYPQLLLIYVDV